jgi:hypothetical protein
MALLYYFTVLDQQGSTLSREETQFAVEDTGRIQSVRLAVLRQEEEQRALKLRRGQDGWRVNDEYAASQQQINMLMRTLNNMQVREPLSDQYRQNAMEDFRREKIVVTITMKNGQQKTLWVGNATPDQEATVMMLADADNPYAVEYPGLQGYLAPRFMPKLQSWRVLPLLQIRKQNLKSVEVRFRNQDSSFKLVRPQPKSMWKLASGHKVAPPVVASYTDIFGQANALRYVEDSAQALRDSLTQVTPLNIMIVTPFQGEATKLLFYPHPTEPGNMYCLRKGDSRVYVVQHAVFDKYLRQRSHFLKSRQDQSPQQAGKGLKPPA